MSRYVPSHLIFFLLTMDEAIQRLGVIKSDLLLAFINNDDKTRDVFLGKVESDLDLLQKNLDCAVN